MSAYRKEGTFEKPITTVNGIAMLLLIIVLAGVAIAGFGIVKRGFVFPGIALGIAIAFLACGFFRLQPNEASVLRAGADVVADALRDELQPRVQLAGVKVEEAKLTHLAYAPEIAGAMLRRQQAEAVISARAKIVIGAVSMVSNLMVVLCSERDTQPIVNTGTLYT